LALAPKLLSGVQDLDKLLVGDDDDDADDVTVEVNELLSRLQPTTTRRHPFLPKTQPSDGSHALHGVSPNSPTRFDAAAVYTTRRT
jgi:hypothetical protein